MDFNYIPKSQSSYNNNQNENNNNLAYQGSSFGNLQSQDLNNNNNNPNSLMNSRLNNIPAQNTLPTSINSLIQQIKEPHQEQDPIRKPNPPLEQTIQKGLGGGASNSGSDEESNTNAQDKSKVSKQKPSELNTLEIFINDCKLLDHKIMTKIHFGKKQFVFELSENIQHIPVATTTSNANNNVPINSVNNNQITKEASNNVNVNQNVIQSENTINFQSNGEGSNGPSQLNLNQQNPSQQLQPPVVTQQTVTQPPVDKKKLEIPFKDIINLAVFKDLNQIKLTTKYPFKEYKELSPNTKKTTQWIEHKLMDKLPFDKPLPNFQPDQEIVITCIYQKNQLTKSGTNRKSHLAKIQEEQLPLEIDGIKQQNYQQVQNYYKQSESKDGKIDMKDGSQSILNSDKGDEKNTLTNVSSIKLSLIEKKSENLDISKSEGTSKKQQQQNLKLEQFQAQLLQMQINQQQQNLGQAMSQSNIQNQQAVGNINIQLQGQNQLMVKQQQISPFNMQGEQPSMNNFSQISQQSHQSQTQQQINQQNFQQQQIQGQQQILLQQQQQNLQQNFMQNSQIQTPQTAQTPQQSQNSQISGQNQQLQFQPNNHILNNFLKNQSQQQNPYIVVQNKNYNSALPVQNQEENFNISKISSKINNKMLSIQPNSNLNQNNSETNPSQQNPQIVNLQDQNQQLNQKISKSEKKLEKKRMKQQLQLQQQQQQQMIQQQSQLHENFQMDLENSNQSHNFMNPVNPQKENQMTIEDFEENDELRLPILENSKITEINKFINDLKNQNQENKIKDIVQILKIKKFNTKIYEGKIICPLITCMQEFKSQQTLFNHLKKKHKEFVDLQITINNTTGKFELSSKALEFGLIMSKAYPMFVKQTIIDMKAKEKLPKETVV